MTVFLIWCTQKVLGHATVRGSHGPPRFRLEVLSMPAHLALYSVVLLVHEDVGGRWLLGAGLLASPLRGPFVLPLTRQQNLERVAVALLVEVCSHPAGI